MQGMSRTFTKGIFRERNGGFMEQENKTVTEIIEEVKEQMCDDYCRYPREQSMAEMAINDICENCPMNRLS